MDIPLPPSQLTTNLVIVIGLTASALDNRRAARGVVSDTAEKLSNMKINGNRTRPTMQQQQPLRPPLMKAGVRWIGEPGDVYLRPVREVQPVRPYARKVAG